MKSGKTNLVNKILKSFFVVLKLATNKEKIINGAIILPAWYVYKPRANIMAEGKYFFLRNRSEARINWKVSILVSQAPREKWRFHGLNVSNITDIKATLSDFGEIALIRKYRNNGINDPIKIEGSRTAKGVRPKIATKGTVR